MLHVVHVCRTQKAQCFMIGRGSGSADFACASRMTTPRCVASASRAAQTGLRLRVAAAPRIQSACLARVMATFMRRTSAKNPTPALGQMHPYQAWQETYRTKFRQHC